MSVDKLKDLESFLNRENKRTYLEEGVFNMLNGIKASESKTQIIKHFIRFIERYNSDIAEGKANETILVGGKYEALQKVESIDWEKILLALDRYECETDYVAMKESADNDEDDSDEDDDDEDLDDGI